MSRDVKQRTWILVLYFLFKDFLQRYSDAQIEFES